jgi:hypothetical protein
MGTAADYILLQDPHRCPQCRARRSFTGGNCANCGMRLFTNPINFKQYEDDGNPRRYWLWRHDVGWVHRDHVMEGLKPQSRIVHFSSPEPNTKDSVKQRLAGIRADTDRKAREMRHKGNVFGVKKP